MSRPICGGCVVSISATATWSVCAGGETAPATSSHARIAWPITTLKTSSGDTPMSNGFHIEPSTTRMDQQKIQHPGREEAGVGVVEHVPPRCECVEPQPECF